MSTLAFTNLASSSGFRSTNLRMFTIHIRSFLQKLSSLKVIGIGSKTKELLPPTPTTLADKEFETSSSEFGTLAGSAPDLQNAPANVVKQNNCRRLSAAILWSPRRPR